MSVKGSAWRGECLERKVFVEENVCKRKCLQGKVSVKENACKRKWGSS
ncbi:hypothetical protein HMPREF0322_05419 [Desulfitobacterium hafniense DP7]|uniref:Uncharacterized protein n=1 Tax=Desulfitobacterium hafniense DP7 TaxID=537010 RepID=G9XWQ2_DESHA|nr:hypothetical protein HMPREF0322_05419 [Desulfitobacterium hafniense DP7]